MNAQLNSLVPQTDQANALDVTRHSFKDLVLAQYKAKEPTILALVAKHANVAFDCTTTKGMAAAKAARLELREHGRFMLQNVAKDTKAEANELKTVIDSESARLIALIRPVEDAIDEQIAAEEKRKADEKAERERLAAERKAFHEGKIATIRGCATRARGLPSERIRDGIAQVEAIVLGDDCQEFLPGYEAAKTETLAAMRVLLDETEQREQAEAQRLENERVAADLAAQRRALEEQAAEIARQRAQQEAEQAAAERARLSAKTHAAVFNFPEPVSTPAAADAVLQKVEASESPVAVEPEAVVQPITMVPVVSEASPPAQVADAAPVAPAADEVAWINTTTLGERVGVPMSTTLVEQLGFPGEKRAGKPGLWWPATKVVPVGQALIALIERHIKAA